MEGSGHGLMWSTNPAFTTSDRKIMKSLRIVNVLAKIRDRHQPKLEALESTILPGLIVQILN
jgi:hypothetical protein